MATESITVGAARSIHRDSPFPFALHLVLKSLSRTRFPSSGFRPEPATEVTVAEFSHPPTQVRGGEHDRFLTWLPPQKNLFRYTNLLPTLKFFARISQSRWLTNCSERPPSSEDVSFDENIVDCCQALFHFHVMFHFHVISTIFDANRLVVAYYTDAPVDFTRVEG